MITDECTSDLLDLLQLANGTVLIYELILLYKSYYYGYSYYILYDFKNLIEVSVEILELDLKLVKTRPH